MSRNRASSWIIAGLPRILRRAAVANLFLVFIAERRRAEPLADLVHEPDNCGGERGAVAASVADRVNQPLKGGSRVPLTEGNPTIEEAAKRAGGVVVVREDEQRGLGPHKLSMGRLSSDAS